MTTQEATRVIRNFDPNSRRKPTPGERRALAAAGYAKMDGACCVLNDRGRAILADYYKSLGERSIHVIDERGDA